MNQLETDTYPEKIYAEITTRCNHGHIEVLYTSTVKGGRDAA